MSTVLYIDIARNKNKLIKILVYTAVFYLVCFVLSLIIDAVLPSVNDKLIFPNAIASFLVFYEWHEHLYANLWSIATFILPFIFVFILAEGFSCSLVEEEEFETLCYMRNLGIDRKVIFSSKLLLRLGWFAVVCFATFLENLIFFLILSEKSMMIAVATYCIKLFLIGILYLCIATFIASVSIRERTCSRACFILLLAQFLVARICVYIRLLADSLFVSGKKYNEIEWLYGVSAKFELLRMLCPVEWCYPGAKMSVAFIICAIVIGVILSVVGYSIYTRDRVVYRNQ